MPQSHAQHAAPNPKHNIKAIRTVRFWAAPLIITLALMSALCALYLGGILNPSSNLHHFPIAVVNEDAGPGVRRSPTGWSMGWTRTSSTSACSPAARPNVNWTPAGCTGRS